MCPCLISYQAGAGFVVIFRQNCLFREGIKVLHVRFCCMNYLNRDSALQNKSILSGLHTACHLPGLLP